MKKKSKGIALLCAAALAAMMFIGCASTDTPSTQTAEESTAAETATAEQSATTEDSALVVQVESVDGNTVTGTIGSLEQQAMPEGGEMPSDGEMPEMPSDGEIPEMPSDGEVPEMPSGEMPSGDGEVPEMPSGGEMPEGGMPGGSQFVAGDETITFELTDDTSITVEFLEGSQDGTAESIAVGAVLEVTLDDGGNATQVIVKNLSAGGGFGSSGEVTNGSAANTISEDGTYSGETYASTGDDENALRIDGAQVTLENVTVDKSGGESSNTEDGDFYGQNAALLVMNGATATITGATVTTDAANGNGVFSYGEGTTVNISDSKISTVQNNSGGIQTTGGGITNATNLEVTTQGNSAAAIRSDRGGGTVVVSGGTYTTNGTGSPAVYSTADITVSDATLSATSSEAVVVEGQNSVALTDCTVTGNMTGTYGGTEETSGHIHNIMIYQSMSGDADVGLASFSATGGSIVSQNGDMFYVTNTSCNISLSGVALTLGSDTLLSVEGNDASRGWGTVGANGGNVNFTADAQEMEGIIHVDEISTLELTMANATSFTGSINSDGQEGDVNVVLDGTSTWTLTADSYITSFDGDTANIVANGFTLYVNGEAVN